MGKDLSKKAQNEQGKILKQIKKEVDNVGKKTKNTQTKENIVYKPLKKEVKK